MPAISHICYFQMRFHTRNSEFYFAVEVKPTFGRLIVFPFCFDRVSKYFLIEYERKFFALEIGNWRSSAKFEKHEALFHYRSYTYG